MKTKELVELIRQGVTPIVRFQDPHSHGELEPDPGMLGRILEVGQVDEYDPKESTVDFTVDFLEFTEQNKAFATRNFYDANGQPTLTWMETDYYEKSAICRIHEMYKSGGELCDLEHFEIVSENKILTEYLESGSKLTYTNWLEEKLLAKEES